nr:hypothetical protein CFP56_17505 [Quercus suber]
MQDVHEMRLDSDEGSLQGERSVSNVPKHSHHSEQDREIENLQKQVRELEIEIRANVCLTKAVYNQAPQPTLQVQTEESLGRALSPNIKVLCHLKEKDVEVEATLESITTGCLVGLVFEVVSLAGEVTVVAVIGAKVCSTGGTSDPVEGLSETLGLFLRVRGVGIEVC